MFTQDKYVSIAFPFKICENGVNLVFSTRDGLVLDAATTSSMISVVLLNDWLDTGDPDQVLDAMACGSTVGIDIWQNIHNLVIHENGYLRFDNDPANANPVTHPAYHLDINYSNTATYKIGCRAYLSEQQMMNLLDPAKPVIYLDRF